MLAAMEPKTMQKAVQISGALINEAVRNGSIKKVEKLGNVGEPRKDKNYRDDNKRTRTGNAFAMTANPIGRENTKILSGADNRPPMLEKDMYDSWKSRMELYMMNRQHGRMILESVENGPLIWPTIEENGVTRPRKYSELFATDAIQANCDVKETNIIFQGLPLEVYALVSNHRIAMELWERIQLLMQGTLLMK
ncbi:hypothetical protein Tco_0956738, partial [Tanacetum coccineum]